MIPWPSSLLLRGLVHLLVGASPRWIGCAPNRSQRIYFANHTSHFDTLAIWSALPSKLRRQTRPVAAADYWNKGIVRKHVSARVLRAVYIDRQRTNSAADPLMPLGNALTQGDSLILFPEGTRSASALPGTFKAGLYHLAERFPHVELIPVYLDNLHRTMPKGSFFPVPMVCTVRFGAALSLRTGESKSDFLERARAAVIALS